MGKLELGAERMIAGRDSRPPRLGFRSKSRRKIITKLSDNRKGSDRPRTRFLAQVHSSRQKIVEDGESYTNRDCDDAEDYVQHPNILCLGEFQ